MYGRSRTILFLIAVLILGLLVACDKSSSPPQVSEIQVEPSTTIQVTDNASLMVQSSGEELQFKWTVSRGSLSSDTTPSVIYTAPDTSGPDIVTIEVSSKGGSIIRSITFDVIEPSPTLEPTHTPTLTLTPTLPPVPTSTSTPPPSLTPTQPPPPLVEIFQQVGDGEEFVFINQGGILTNEFVPTQSCIHSGVYGLRLTYDMKGAGNGGWGVHWVNSPAQRFDASDYTAFVFWIKGASGGEIFQVGLKDTRGKEVKVETKPLVVVSPNTWSEVTILLTKFEGVDTSSINNLNFGFNKNHGSGSICLDDISFASP